VLTATPASGGSRWSALFNPVVFQYQRQDYQLLDISFDGSGNMLLTIDSLLTDAQIATLVGTDAIKGTPVYVKTTQYQFTAIPTAAVLTGNLSGTILTLPGISNKGTDAFGYVNAITLKTAFKYVTEITAGYDGATTLLTAEHAPNTKGQCRADVAKYLRQLMQPKDDFDYSVINYRDANISASYTVRYRESFEEQSPLDINNAWRPVTDPFYITYSAMQIGNKTGGNMLPYVTSPQANQSMPAKFLNDFKIPRFYADMPFDLAFIYSEQLLGYQIKLGGNGIDINGNISGALGELMLLNEDNSVLLNQDGSKLLIEKQAPGVLISKLGVNRLQITQNIPANSVWLDVFLFYTDASGNDIQVTENRRLLIDSAPCNNDPYEYLKWIGPTGGWMYYMLLKNQIYEINTSNAVLMERYIEDYATADSSQELISITAQKRITAGANDIAADEAEGLATILYSPKVYRLVDKASNQWQTVIMDTQSLKMYQTYGNLGDFEISYLLPEINVQRS
jgi:hypothetical protein